MYFRLLILALLFGSCQEEIAYHEQFMDESDCYVYQNEIIKQQRKGYTIEHINTTEASDCVKKQLGQTHIIHFQDSLGLESVVMVTKTPEKYIQEVKEWALIYGSKNLRLTHMNENKNNIKLILSKLYLKSSDTLFDNRFRPFKEITMKNEHSIWVEESSNINPYWPWNNPR
ncbi:MAG: hypothetical protein RL365_2205 [Bacteroidota bacterium]|jgi:hypothetical protein